MYFFIYIITYKTKTNKRFFLDSNIQYTHPGFLKTREETEEWLKSMGIDKYTIKDDLTVDVDSGVFNVGGMSNLEYLPVRFGYVSGDFIIMGANLKTLKGSPISVESFNCSNNNLISLEHCPKYVSDYFNCSHNKITSTNHSPKVKNHFISSWYYGNLITSEIPSSYQYQENPSWMTTDKNIISERLFNKIQDLDIDVISSVLCMIKKEQPDLYNSEEFQSYKPSFYIDLLESSAKATGGLFTL